MTGLSQREELASLTAVGLTTIYLGYEETGRVDRFGNRFKFKGRGLVLKRGVERPRQVFDVFLAMEATQ